jgi:hypothetical protein
MSQPATDTTPLPNEPFHGKVEERDGKIKVYLKNRDGIHQFL